MKKVAFIGAGNMGGALLSAVAATKSYAVAAVEPNAQLSAQLAQNGVEMLTAIQAVQTADVVFLGVKPQILRDVVAGFAASIPAKAPLFVSMAAGVGLAQLQTMLGDVPIIRIMPNTSVAVGQGMVLYCPNQKVDTQQVQLFADMLRLAGVLDRLDEKFIDAASAVSGCGPAYVYMFIEALADGAVACGLPRNKALLYAEQTLLGAAMMAQQSPKHPEQLKDDVCSPGGSTIAGVRALEEGAFRADVSAAVVAAYERTKQLGK